MPNPSGADRDDASNQTVPDPGAETTEPGTDDVAPVGQHDPDEQITDSYPIVAPDTEAPTEVLSTGAQPRPEVTQPEPERRFTAPGFDAGATEVIQSVPEAPTEVFRPQSGRRARPQLIPPRLARKLPTSGGSRSWGWVLALILIVVTLAAIAVLGTVWLTRAVAPKVSQEERVRSAIYDYDIAVQNGDLPALRGLTCGSARDTYLNYSEQSWDDTYRRVAAAKQYPVVASIDDVVVNGEHAEANVTAFMAYAPQVRSTRSFDLQYRDDQWKICQSPTG